MTIDPELQKKIKVGDGLSDKELATALKFYQEMAEGLRCLGNEFHIAWLPVFGTLCSLEDSDRSRKEKR